LIWQLNDCWPVQSWAVLDSNGVYKAAAYELRRLHAPALASLQFEVGDDRLRLWTMLDNAHGPVRGEAVVEARRLSDGQVLERRVEQVELLPGSRGVSIELDVSPFSAPDTLVCASFLGSHTFRLLSEPKHSRLLSPHLSASRHPEGVLLSSDRPVVDLFLWDPEERVQFLDNFVTLPAAGTQLLRARGSWQRLCARSLLGRHALQT
jgi:beta-mannosidase